MPNAPTIVSPAEKWPVMERNDPGFTPFGPAGKTDLPFNVKVVLDGTVHAGTRTLIVAGTGNGADGCRGVAAGTGVRGIVVLLLPPSSFAHDSVIVTLRAVLSAVYPACCVTFMPASFHFKSELMNCAIHSAGLGVASAAPAPTPLPRTFLK